MVAEGSLERRITGVDEPLHHDLGTRRRMQAGQRAAPDPASAAAQQSGKLELRKRIRDRCDRSQRRSRIHPDRHHDREGLVGMHPQMVLVVERAAAVSEPAHDHPARADRLLAVDGDVFPPLGRPAGDHEAEGDQGPGVPGPAGLYRQAPEVYCVALDDLIVERRVVNLARRHVCKLGEFGPLRQCVLERAGPARLPDRCQQSAQLA